MVSEIYAASKYYKLQKEGKIGKNYNNKSEKALFKVRGKNQYFIYNYKRKDGKKILVKEYLKPGDLVYNRSEGVAHYDMKRDLKRPHTMNKHNFVEKKKTDHIKRAQMGDMIFRGKNYDY